ncbi:1016_t:CDS:2 [Ambispora leptoticha]|uniref:Fructose-bisphosphate aldolase n=1 Tax=Ambispora leptoticha TaxID=144679 RepID=A0A9N9HU08_9GLOM|nr:1016_t:CDS:2 [Ambispora leptoticha]
MELGITGGEEDGSMSDLFTIAAAFGNLHDVYKPGNVKLSLILLKKHQEYVKEKTGMKSDKPVWLVFHGGSGSLATEISDAVSYGVVKMNVDTDTQWAYWEGIRNFFESKKGYLQTQVGNPEGLDKPNKKAL